ncbi:MAG: response regulator transcription factor [Actinomycetes bacterium]
MPVMDGLQAARALRDRAPALPVIILSAYEDPALKREAAAANAYAYLVRAARVRWSSTPSSRRSRRPASPAVALYPRIARSAAPVSPRSSSTASASVARSSSDR